MNSKGHADVLIGLQYGDEGKAKIIDALAPEYDIISRFQGGANAGHTVVAEGKKVSLHQVPSGIFYKDKILYIGSGCVVDPVALLEELSEIKNAGVDLEGRLHISDLATVVMPYHIALDKATGKEIMSTGRGIGPSHMDKAGRMHNYRICDLLEFKRITKSTIKNRICETLKYYNILRENLAPEAEKTTLRDVLKTIDALNSIQKLIETDKTFLVNHLRSGKKVLFEGAQAALLSVDKGTVPYVTSSYTAPGFAAVGGDVPLKYFRKVIGVAKAIMSRVGNGPFVSEFGGEHSEKYCAEPDDLGRPGHKNTEQAEKAFLATLSATPEEIMKEFEFSTESIRNEKYLKAGICLRILTGEYGATTKRPRRIGALDLVLLRETCKLHGVDELYLNKMDCLNYFKNIPLVQWYTIDEKLLENVPSSNEALRMANPKTITTIPMPNNCIVSYIETAIMTRIAGYGTGPERKDIIFTADSKSRMKWS